MKYVTINVFYLVIARITNARYKKKEKTKKLNVQKLQDPDICNSFQAQIGRTLHETLSNVINEDHKAPGEDGLPAELFKYGGEELHRTLYDLVLEIWVQKMPQQWSSALICSLHKKGEQLECSNYR
nr:uncharacterized protein LOC106679091 [Halyomorpha halys]